MPVIYTLDDLAPHNTETDCWLAIHGKVYRLDDFLDEHPGGYDIVVSNSGKDATEEFEEIGHSKTAVEMLDQYYIGDLSGGEFSASSRTPKAAKSAAAPAPPAASSSAAGTLLKALLPVLVVAAAVLYAVYGQPKV